MISMVVPVVSSAVRINQVLASNARWVTIRSTVSVARSTLDDSRGWSGFGVLGVH